MRDHWWWRPGWQQGRSFYTWFITFERDEALHHLVRHYHARLTGADGLDLVPTDWLHLTVQGLGFTDEITRHERDDVAAAVRDRLATMPPRQVSFHRPVIHTEAVVLPADPPAALQEIRDEIRDATAHRIGADRVDGPAHGYRPHVSLAYSSTTQPSAELAEALSTGDPPAATTTIGRVSLVDLNRDHRAYRWHTTPAMTATLAP